MTGVKSFFTYKEFEFIKNSVGLELSDTKDYTDDELADIFDFLTENLPFDYDNNGYPLERGQLFESIVDKFLNYFNI